jgi:hypothetical protein
LGKIKTKIQGEMMVELEIKTTKELNYDLWWSCQNTTDNTFHKKLMKQKWVSVESLKAYIHERCGKENDVALGVIASLVLDLGD